MRISLFSVSAVDISRIDLILHILQSVIHTVGYDHIRVILELVKITDYFRMEELVVFQCRFVYHHFDSLGFDTFHDSLDGGLSEVI